ncbi:MAG: ATP-binding protein [Saprospiraceae bacterium]
MSAAVVISTSLAYLLLLFLIAYYAERREAQGKSIVRNPFIYALSLAVYCTAWTFYGSVGRAVTVGAGFLPIYLGPTLLAPLWILLLRKMIIISKQQRITSVADFISSRYGKSTSLGVIATIVALLGIIPYVSIQLKAIVTSFDILTASKNKFFETIDVPLYYDTSLYVAIALAIFTILFGTRHLDPNERHEGLVAAIAFESVVKLVAFLAVGTFVTFGIFNGFADVFTQGLKNDAIAKLYSLTESGIDSMEWFWLTIISTCAVLFLPRQFHVAVVENTDANHVTRAAWLFPLYLLLINIFVLPIAIGGLLIFQNGNVEPDTFVLSIPLAYGKDVLALLVTIGGFSAATSMVITAVIALSIMINNNLVMPALLRFRSMEEVSLTRHLLNIRRISIIVVLLLAYLYYKSVSLSYSLVSIGLMSFTAAAQFAPAILLGMYWKRSTKTGAITGLSIGALIWAFTLPFPNLIEAGIVPSHIVEQGLFGWSWLRPYALFGLEGMDYITHSAFWSLLFNTSTLVFVSLYTTQSPLELAQADIFVNIYKYARGGTDYEIMRRRAKVQDIRHLLHRFLGETRTKRLLNKYEKLHDIDLSKEKIANAELVNYAEIHLTGAIGAASAKILISSVAKEDPISLEEMLNVLEQTQEIMQYSQALEKKSEELERMTQQLQHANAQLQELDRMKADFVTTVTHELRTPITSIKALSKILLDNPDLNLEKRSEFLEIITTESERITRLINQVLDLEKIQSEKDKGTLQTLDFVKLVEKAYLSLQPLLNEKNVQHTFTIHHNDLKIMGNADRLTQVVVNLLGNAVKFCKNSINIILECNNSNAILHIQDDGRGIAMQDQAAIFEKFIQVNDVHEGKPQGSGLGLFISKTIVEQHGGTITVESEPDKGATFTVSIPLLNRQMD